MSFRSSFLPITLALVFVLFGITPCAKTSRDWTRDALSPVYHFGWVGGNYVSRRFEFAGKVFSLARDTIYLSEQLNLAYSQLVFYQSLYEENQSLRKQLSVSREEDYFRPVLAKILGFAQGGASTSFYLDQGSNSGVKVGDCVVSGSFLLGRVLEVFPNSCLVRLINAPDSRIDAYIERGGLSQVRGIVRGDYGSRLVMERILSDLPLVTGELVVAVSEDYGFPTNLILGRLEKVTSRDHEPVKSASLESLVDWLSLKTVFIMTY